MKYVVIKQSLVIQYTFNKNNKVHLLFTLIIISIYINHKTLSFLTKKKKAK